VLLSTTGTTAQGSLDIHDEATQKQLRDIRTGWPPQPEPAYWALCSVRAQGPSGRPTAETWPADCCAGSLLSRW